ncbi:hypothetical protein BDV18DRAFT_71249 [Aspergillus unguis]
MYSSQPRSYPYTTTPTNAGPRYVSPPEPRRADNEEDKPRQTLPSIQEALGNYNPRLYPGSPRSAPQQSHSAPPHHMSNFAGRPGAGGPPGPPNPFLNGVPINESRPYVGARMDKMNCGIPGHTFPGVSQNDTMERHLIVCQVETSLNKMVDLSSRLLDFSRHYAARAHQSRSGPVIGSSPSVQEVEEMLNAHRRNHEALMHLRSAVLSQEHALAKQMTQRKVFKASGLHDDNQMAMYQGKFKSKGEFAGLESEKRHSKAAPPGRCHSCNRAETPEWRRGPDGARTLCNACGLHYAKLTRRMGANKERNK